MATTYSANLALPVPASGDDGWGPTLIALFAVLDALAPLAAGYVRPSESPSSTLKVDVNAGAYVKADGSRGTFAAVSGHALSASTTTSIYVTNAGAIVYSTTGFPVATPLVRLASVVTGAAVVTSVVDERSVLGVSSS